jgi:hypothetical protein
MANAAAINMHTCHFRPTPSLQSLQVQRLRIRLDQTRIDQITRPNHQTRVPESHDPGFPVGIRA